MPFGDTVTCLSIDDDASMRDGGIFVAGGINKRLHIYELRTGRLLREIHTEDSISVRERARSAALPQRAADRMCLLVHAR